MVDKKVDVVEKKLDDVTDLMKGKKIKRGTDLFRIFHIM